MARSSSHPRLSATRRCNSCCCMALASVQVAQWLWQLRANRPLRFWKLTCVTMTALSAAMRSLSRSRLSCCQLPAAAARRLLGLYIYKNQTGILNNNFLVQCCSRHWHRRRRQSPVHTPRAYKCSRALCRLASACYFSLAVHVNTSFFDAPSLNRKPNGLFRMPKKTRLCRLQRSNASRRKRRALLPTLAIFLTGW